jgi:hypothetical protein
MKLKLSEWANIAEVLGAVAIVVSLIFVRVQISDGNRETRLSVNAQKKTFRGYDRYVLERPVVAVGHFVQSGRRLSPIGGRSAFPLQRSK